jgi:hypothetical protein
MKTFKGFTNQQTHQLLKEMGFTGPAQKDEMDAFLASSPSAASKIGRYAEIAKQRVEGGPLSGMGFAQGDLVEKVKDPNEYTAVSRITPNVSTDVGTIENSNFTGETGNLLDPNASIDSSKATTPSYKFTYDQAVARQAQRDVKSPEEARAIQIALDMGPDAIPAPEGSEVLSVGTASPETTQPSIDLDTAQQSYSDAMGQLTEAQKALTNVEMPEGSSIDPATNRLPNASYEQILEEVGPFTSDFDSYVGDFKPFEVDDFKSLVASGNIPEDPSDYEIEPLGSEGINKKFLIKYPNGQSIEYSTYSAAVANSAPDIASMFAQGLNQAKDSKIYSETNNYNQLLTDVENADELVTQTGADVATKQKQFETTDIPSTSEALGKAITTPSSVLQKPTVYGLKVEDDQLIDEDTGQVATAASLLVKQAQAADAVEDPAVKATLAYLSGLTEEEKASKYPMPSPPEGNWGGFLGLFFQEPDADAIKEYNDAVAGVHARIEQDAIKSRAETYTAVMSQDKVKTALEDFAAATGTPSSDALMKAETMLPEDLAQLDLDAETLDIIREIPEVKRTLDAGEVPTAALFDEYTKSEAAEFEGEVGEVDPAKFETETPKAEAEVDYNLPPSEVAEVEKSKVEDAANFNEYATAEEKKSEFVPEITAEETAVGDEEIVDVNNIINSEEVIVAGKTLEALNEASTAKAATATFTQQLAAKAVKGEVSAASTVQFQMEKLMKSFDDGTPAWAAGALRKANAAMNARGLGNSSMAAAAIIQASLESAIPIAQQDAATFQAMDMENVRNEQAVALANAAAAQNFELANLSNEQATRIQNSMNNANLQLKNLSNEQEAVLATAQFKAALLGQELDISANVAIANAARYAAVNDINLTNRQQTSILKSTQNLEVEMANLSNSQQTALSNLQVKAAMMGQELTNEQQMAVLESTQAFETNMQDATMRQQAFIQDAVARAAMEGRVLDNKQQTALFNVSNAVAEREIELNNEQQTAIFNMSNKLEVDMTEMSNRQQTALANAQIEAAMKGQELTNKQQVNVIKAERIAEIANLNFSAEQTRVLKNSEMAMSVDLANLSNKQAKLMADVASMANVDMANLNNRQQAAAQQAQAFLQMDMANLDNEQQAVMFEAQSLVQSVLSDQAAENAQLQFNAESINQVNQFFDSMSTQISQFNTAQENAMEQFNAGEENSMTKFQAELDNQRDMFNAQNELVIAQANTVWRQTIATANTAALNEANMAEVMAANNLTMQGLAELWQQERDLLDFAWTSSEKQMDREHELAKANIQADGAEDAAYSSAAGNFLSSVVTAFITKKL